MAHTLLQPGGAPVHLPGQPLGFLGVPWSAISAAPCVSSGELVSGCDPPGGCQLSRISEALVRHWGPAHSLVEDASLGSRLPLAFRLWLSPARLSLQRGEGPVRSRLGLLWCSLNPLFCERAMQSRESLFYFSLWLSHSLGCYLVLAPPDCPRGTRALSLP